MVGDVVIRVKTELRKNHWVGGGTSYIKGDRTCRWNRSHFQACKYANTWGKLSEIYDKVNKVSITCDMKSPVIFFHIPKSRRK